MSSLERDRRLLVRRLSEHGITCKSLSELRSDAEALGSIAPLLLRIQREMSTAQMRVDLVEAATDGGVSATSLAQELRRMRSELAVSPQEKVGSLRGLSGKELVASLARMRSASAATRGAQRVAWALADALNKRADESSYSDLIDLVSDQSLGRSRQMLVLALARVGADKREAGEVLIRCLEDPDLARQARDALSWVQNGEHLSGGRSVQTGGSGGRDKSFSEQECVICEHVAEMSSNFDVEEVPQFLKSLASGDLRLVVPSQLDDFIAELPILEIGDERTIDLRFEAAGTAVGVLRVSAFMSDRGALDLGFYGSDWIIEIVERRLDELD